jgi:hypothetical protein
MFCLCALHISTAGSWQIIGLIGEKEIRMMKSRRNFFAALLGTAAILPTSKLPTPRNVYNHLNCCWTWYETKEILNALPVRRNDISSRKEAYFTILSDLRRQDLIRLNPVAARIWELCDGRNSVDHMALGLMNDYDVSPGVCVNDVILTLRTLKRKGLVSC